MLAAGLRPEDFGEEVIEIWPENEAVITLFGNLGTQWRVGMGGVIGLDYNVMFHLMDRMNLSPQDYDHLFADMRVAEAEAISILNAKE
jgi:hypothetical protein